MKFDQICFAAYTEAGETKLKQWLGLTNEPWIIDIVATKSRVKLNDSWWDTENTAELQFNYSLSLEIEILKYLSGTNFHQSHPAFKANYPVFNSHVGAHLDDGEEFPAFPESMLVQESFTQTHTGEYLTKPGSPGYGRKYHYKIYALAPGSFVKFIRRINPK